MDHKIFIFLQNVFLFKALAPKTSSLFVDPATAAAAAEWGDDPRGLANKVCRKKIYKFCLVSQGGLEKGGGLDL